jgi:hypothetical protein
MRSFITCPSRINIIIMIKLRMKRRAGHIARMEQKRGAYEVKAGNYKEKDH